jgi:sec-independent protein translocase protein TatA
MELFTPGHLIVLLLVGAILLFGWKQLPDMARSLGRSLRIFKTEINGMSADDQAREAAKADVQPAPPPPAVAPPAVPQQPAQPAQPAQSSVQPAQPAQPDSTAAGS